MSMPFVNEEFTFINPDGTSIQVRGSGNQYYAVFESLDGYTLVKDPDTGFYQYATLSDDQSQLVPTHGKVGHVDPQSLGLQPQVRIRHDDARRQEAKKEIDAIKATFTPRNIIAGAEILSAVSEEFKLRNMKVWFARYGNLSWILSYVRGQAEKQLLTAEGSTTSALK